MITASHNAAADNGIKFFRSDGRKLTDEEESRIEAGVGLIACTSVLDATTFVVPPCPFADEYISTVSRLLPVGALRGWRIVLDTANGATCTTSPAVFAGLGAEVLCLGNTPDGQNINAGVGSEHPAGLSAKVLASGARLGVAHDGDGDRCVLCDELGGVLDGDEIMTLLAVHALARGSLAARTLVVTVQSNLGVDAAVEAAGGRVARSAVGDRYVVELMRKEGATFGGESSGHLIFSEYSPAGDGLVAALKVIEVMIATGRPLSELRRTLRKFPQASESVPVREKKPLAEMPALTAAIRSLEAELGARGRVLVRYSGTESKLRLLVEGPTVEATRAGLERLKAAIGGQAVKC
jgi:phosphoglucosamine mutase